MEIVNLGLLICLIICIVIGIEIDNDVKLVVSLATDCRHIQSNLMAI